eukprot:c54433_g1_i1 orf=2-241(+)
MNFVRVEGLEMILMCFDMDKAYGRIEWSYILVVLERMGLGPNFRRMVAALFGNASASILVNGCPSGSYALNRSIRQGVP